MKVHTPSLLAGLGLAALIGITLGQQIVGSPALEILRVVEPVVVHTPAHPSNFVIIKEGSPYTVPSDRLLVVTAIGHSRPVQGSYEVQLHIGGVAEATVVAGISSSPLHSQMAPLAEPGLVVPPGSLVDVVGGDTNPDDSRAWGYLAEDD